MTIAKQPEAALLLVWAKFPDVILAVGRRHDTYDLGLPGGKVDLGETPLQAAVREAREETGYPFLARESSPWHSPITPCFHHQDGTPSGRPVTVFMCTCEKILPVDRYVQYRRPEDRNLRVDWVPHFMLLRPASTFATFNRRLFQNLGWRI